MRKNLGVRNLILEMNRLMIDKLNNYQNFIEEDMEEISMINNSVVKRKKKFISASAIIFKENTHNFKETKKIDIPYSGNTDSETRIEILSKLKGALENEPTENVKIDTKENIEIFPIKLHFIRSKEPIGVGRFGVVYKASIQSIKLPKKKSSSVKTERQVALLDSYISAIFKGS